MSIQPALESDFFWGLRLLKKLNDERAGLEQANQTISEMFANGIVDGFSEEPLGGNILCGVHSHYG